MPENYKLFYEQMKKMVDMYQDEIVPGFRKTTDELKAENKSLHQQLETMRQDRDYYRDAYHHLLKERENRDTLPRADIINT